MESLNQEGLSQKGMEGQKGQESLSQEVMEDLSQKGQEGQESLSQEGQEVMEDLSLACLSHQGQDQSHLKPHLPW